MLRHLETKILAKHKQQPIISKHGNHKEDKQIQKSHHHQEQQHSQSLSYNVNLQYNPQTPEAEKSTKLAIYITEQQSGDVI